MRRSVSSLCNACVIVGWGGRVHPHFVYMDLSMNFHFLKWGTFPTEVSRCLSLFSLRPREPSSFRGRRNEVQTYCVTEGSCVLSENLLFYKTGICVQSALLFNAFLMLCFKRFYFTLPPTSFYVQVCWIVSPVYLFINFNFEWIESKWDSGYWSGQLVCNVSFLKFAIFCQHESRILLRLWCLCEETFNCKF